MVKHLEGTQSVAIKQICVIVILASYPIPTKIMLKTALNNMDLCFVILEPYLQFKLECLSHTMFFEKTIKDQMVIQSQALYFLQTFVGLNNFGPCLVRLS